MLREQVLEVWNGFKEKYLKELDLLDQISSNLNNMTFLTGGFGIKETPCQVMKELKKRLPSITQSCHQLRNKYTSGQFGDLALEVESIYFAYIEIVFVYEKIIEYYDEPPTND